MLLSTPQGENSPVTLGTLRVLSPIDWEHFDWTPDQPPNWCLRTRASNLGDRALLEWKARHMVLLFIGALRKHVELESHQRLLDMPASLLPDSSPVDSFPFYLDSLPAVCI